MPDVRSSDTGVNKRGSGFFVGEFFEVLRWTFKAASILPFHDKPGMHDTIGRNLNRYFWYRRKVSEGTKGPIEYEFTKRRVVLSRAGLPAREVWLIIRRTLDEAPTYSYFISNAGLSAASSSSCGSAVFAGLWSSVLRKRRLNLAWTTMRGENFPAGFII